MGVFSAKRPATSPRSRQVHVVCGACSCGVDVTTRQQFADFEADHLSGCGSSWVAIDPPLADLLDLPAS
jgi:hypothetical protein